MNFNSQSQKPIFVHNIYDDNRFLRFNLHQFNVNYFTGKTPRKPRSCTTGNASRSGTGWNWTSLNGSGTFTAGTSSTTDVNGAVMINAYLYNMIGII